MRTNKTVVTIGFLLLAAVAGFWWAGGGTEPTRDGAPSWFPDSRTIAFVAETGEGVGDIYSVGIDGRNRRQLTRHPAVDSAPAVSPDGTRIAFESDRDGNFEIYVMNADGSGVTRLTNDPARDGAPAWSPDGRRIAFTSDRGNRASADVWIMDADGTNLQQLTNNLANWAPQFSPDGRSLAVQVNRDIVIFDLESGARRQLTYSPEDGMNPTWSPDGSRLAFVTTRGGRVDIYTMRADGTDVDRLVSVDGASAIDPRWSPDGRSISFVMVPDVPPNAENPGAPDYYPAIYVVDVETRQLTRVSR